MSDVADIERENRSLLKKLSRSEKKMRSLEILQEQNASLLRTLMADLDAERAESERLLLNILPSRWRSGSRRSPASSPTGTTRQA